ncbi:plasmid mobilization relaxosome protein MobC [Pedobacter rhodius]|uniref:Plasmid mobilization relaxosome protein MobC n=1 Tax=Pedobacter rhodius TaxID=3004098 RepID=A0ABT4KX74_9SPHI|nr:plasmid mobilization relaxosome protein MobC [Pedobacter sp. SJ11]MCZ4223533.1 plasmid mobilization relaxosome protein MobC [Pedobacter sp. SJ11]
MPRRRATNQDALLTKNVIVRITETTFNKLEKMRVESGSASMAEVIRRILSNRKIKLLHQDNSLNAPMEEMALIRKELKAIGININQITRTFNQDKAETHRAFYVMKVVDLYKNVDERVEKLLVIISQLAEKWLQK